MMPTKPPALLHIDCDGLWAVRTCYGASASPDPAGDPFWLQGIPAARALLDEFRAPATLFVVGRDLRDAPVHVDLAQEMLEAGHEIASHGAEHLMALRSASPEMIEREVDPSIIRDRLKINPLGFRAPGFSWQGGLPEIVSRAGYRYDSSLFPSPWGPLLRSLRGAMSRSSDPPQEPYGDLATGRAPRAPHRLGDLIEVPVSLTPRLRLPAHASFALLRSDRSFERIVRWHASRSLPFVWLLHLIDLVDTSDLDLPVSRWSRRALCRGGTEKRARLRAMLAIIQRHFEVMRTDRWVESVFDAERDSLD